MAYGKNYKYALLSFLFCFLLPLYGSDFTIIVNDGSGSGFNDTTPAAPMGGNPGTTLGEQRRNALAHAASIWGALLESDIAIEILARFEARDCSGATTFLARGNPTSLVPDFPNAPLSNTWYPVALANALAGVDLRPDSGIGPTDIILVFNSNIDGGETCFPGVKFYYGLDGNTNGDIDFVTLALHELAHGLGIWNTVSLQTGGLLSNRGDVFMNFLKDNSTGKTWPQMNNAERAASAVDTGDLLWIGEKGVNSAQSLTNGLHPSGGIIMHAPATLETDVSVIHLTRDVSPAQLLEPFDITTVNHDPGVALGMLLDMGWTTPPQADLSLGLSASTLEPDFDQVITLTYTLINAGPNGATDVEVSLPLPNGLLYISHSGTGNYFNSSGKWQVAGLSDGASAVLTLNARVQRSGFITVGAEVTASGSPDLDSTPNNNNPAEDDQASLTLAVIRGLQNNQVVSGLTGDADTWQYFELNLPEDVIFFELSTFGGSGDVDLYLRRNDTPDTDNFDFRSQTPGTGESIALENPQAGAWFVGVFGFTDFENVNLTVRYSGDGLVVNVAGVSIGACPQIRVNVAVSDLSGAIEGLDASAFTIRENGSLPLSVVGFRDNGEGQYAMDYQASVFGLDDILLTVAVARGDESAADTTSYTNCTPEGGVLRVRMGSDEIVQEGAIKTVPVYISPIENAFAVRSFELRVLYDTAVYEFVQIIKDCTLVEPWPLVTSNEDTPGSVRVSASNLEALGIQTNVEDVLLGIQFRVKAGVSAGACSDLSFVPQDFVFNNGTPLASLTNGRLCVVGTPPGTEANLSVRLKVSDVTPDVGDRIAVSIALTNRGPNSANNVQVKNLLPEGLDYVSHTEGEDYNPATGIWSPRCVLPGSVRYLGIICTVSGSEPMSNTCEVIAVDEDDPNSTPNNHVEEEDDQETILITPNQADLSCSKTVSNAAPAKNETIAYDITVTNAGPSHATEIEVLDELPAGVAYLSHEGPGEYDLEKWIWKPNVLLDLGESVTLRVYGKVVSKGEWTNAAEIKGARQFDPESGNNIGEATHEPVTTDLSLTHSVDIGTPRQGETVGLTVSVTNNGPLNVTGVCVGHRLPALDPPGMTYVSDNQNGAFADGNWSVGSLSVGQTKTITVFYRIDDVKPKIVAAEVLCTNHFDPDSDPGNNVESEDDQENVTIIPQYADLEVSKTVDNALPFLNDVVTFTVMVGNAAKDPASAVVVKDLLTGGLTYVSHSGDGSYNPTDGLWNAGALAPGNTKTLTVQARVVGKGESVNIAQVYASDQGDPDSKPNNYDPDEDDYAAVSVRPQYADLELAKTVDNTLPDVGDEVVFTLSLYNEGPDSATNVQVRDQLPDGMSLVSASGAGTYSASTHLWNAGTVPAKETVTMAITARLDIAGSKLNVAEVFSVDQPDPDSTPSNNQPLEDDWDSAKLGRADLALTKTVDNDSPDGAESVTFTITVMNHGPDEAGEVEATDQLPTGLLYESHAGGDYDPETGVWRIGSLANGSQASLTITARVFGRSSRTNTAEVTNSNVGDPNSTPNNGDPDENDQDSVTLNPLCPTGSVVVVENADGANEGFNDPRAVNPVGGNTGTTVGEQRLIAFQHAADILAELIDTDVPIVILAEFNPLDCSPFSAVLGSAGANSVAQGFNGAEPDMWYHIALANSIAGEDLNGGDPEIRARFNSSIDSNNNCLNFVNWYYGLDSNPPGNDMDFVTVVLHEILHGMGFSTFVNKATGAKLQGKNDVYMRHLEDHSTGKTWPQMTDGERAASITDPGDLHWTGPNLLASSGILSAGVHPSGHVEMYAPTQLAQGSSVSHFSTSLTPNTLMEPSFTEAIHNPVLELDLLADVGWVCQNQVEEIDLSLSMTVDNPTPVLGEQVTFSLTLHNAGPNQATGVKVKNMLPEGLNYANHSGGDFDELSGVWDVGDLNPGSETSLELRVNVNSAFAQTNEAEVISADQPDKDSSPNNGVYQEDDFASATVEPETIENADLSLVMAADRMEPFVDEDVNLIVTVTNHGPDVATGVVVSLAPNNALSHVSDTSGGGYNPGNGNWNVGGLNINESATFRLTARVESLGGITQSAEVMQADQIDPDSVPGNSDPIEDDYDAVFLSPQSTECARGARILIVNVDGEGEGFNDPTPVTPVGGNPGVTLGEQRLYAFQYAADQFAGTLQSDITVRVSARFDLLACTNDGAILGAAGPTAAARDFEDAPHSGSWYHIALANALAGEDLNGVDAEIEAVFNARIDENDRFPINKTVECDCGTPGNPQTCDSVSMPYVVEKRGNDGIKFEDAPIGLGEDGAHETDRFVIKVSGGSNSVSVTTKAATQSETNTLNGVGDSFKDSLGFCVLLEDISDDGYYTIAVTGGCNRHALSHIEFHFGSGQVVSPVNNYHATRTEVCETGGGGGGGGDDDCRCGLPGDPSLCDSEPITYRLLRQGSKKIKFKEAEVRLGVNGELATDRFIVGVDGGKNSVTVQMWSGGETATDFLTGPGDTLVNDLGFCITLEDITESGLYTFAVTSECNLHPLDYVEFNFGKGQIYLPTDPHEAEVERTQVCDDDGEEEPPGTEICLPGVQWYYGFDGQPGENMDLVTVVIHEFIHGLGFTTFVDLENEGGKLQGYDDIYMRFLKDGSSGKHWFEMNGDERMASARDTGDLFWTGPNVKAAAVSLGAGANQAGETEMYAPNPLQALSSVVHWSPVLWPDQLLEPAYLGANHEMGLALQLLYDLGWSSAACVDLSLTKTVDNETPGVGDNVTFTITVANSGSSDATGVQVTDLLPAGLVYASDDSGGNYNSNTGLWDIGLIPAGTDVRLMVTVEVQASGGKTNIAEVAAADQKDLDSTPGNGVTFEDDWDSASVGNADLRLSKTASRSNAILGELVTFTLTVTNDGADQTDGIKVTDLLPAAFSFVSAEGDGAYVPETGVWTLGGALAASQSAAIAIRVRCEETGTHTNSAEITSANLRDSDSTPANNDPSEDDQAEASVSVTEPVSDVGMVINGVFPSECPLMTTRLIVTDDGLPITGLTAGQFTLKENAVVLPFTFEEHGEIPGGYNLTYESSNTDGQNHDMDVTLSHNGEEINAYADFNICNTLGCTQIVNHQVVRNISGYRGDFTSFFKGDIHCYKIDVPPAQRLLRVELFGGDGDADLLIKHGSEPGFGDYDYRPNIKGNEESVDILDPRSGTWYISIIGFREYVNTNLVVHYYPSVLELDIRGIFTDSCPTVATKVYAARNYEPVDWLTAQDFAVTEDGVSISGLDVEKLPNPGEYMIRFPTNSPDGKKHRLTITATMFGESISNSGDYANCWPACQALENNVTMPDISGQKESWHCFYIDVPADMDFLDVKTWAGEGDSDVYVKLGSLPTEFNFDFRHNKAGNVSLQSIADPPEGRWYIRLYGFLDFTEVNLLARYYKLDLKCGIERVSIAECPINAAYVNVTLNGAAVTGLSAGDFILNEGDGPITPVSVEELESGRYKVRYETEKTEGAEVNLSVQVNHAGVSAFDDELYECCTRSGPAVKVWINKDHGGEPGATVVIPLWTRLIDEDLNVTSMRGYVDYDSSLLAFQGVTLAGGTMDGGFSVDTGDSIPGSVRFSAAASFDGFRLTATDPEENKLMSLIFKVSQSAEVGDSTILDLVNTEIVFNDGLPIAAPVDGRFEVTGCERPIGDVDNDGNDQEAFDSLQILFDVADLPTDYDPIPMCVKDTNCSGKDTLIDVVKVLQKSVRLFDEYCEDTQSRGDVGTFAINIPSADLTAEVGSSFAIDVNLTQLPNEDVFGYGFKISYDPAVITLTGIDTAGTLTDRWGDALIVEEPGMLAVYSINHLSPIPGTGTLVKIVGHASTNPGDTNLSFSEFQLAADSEPEQNFGPFHMTVGGSLCYNPAVYGQLLNDWSQAGQEQVTILDILDLLSCLGKNDE